MSESIFVPYLGLNHLLTFDGTPIGSFGDQRGWMAKINKKSSPVKHKISQSPAIVIKSHSYGAALYAKASKAQRFDEANRLIRTVRNSRDPWI